MAKNNCVLLNKNMSIDKNDFFRLLPNALIDYHYTVKDNIIEIKYAKGMIILTLNNQPARRLGALSLPVLRVSFQFNEVTDDESKHFIQHFDHSYRRGGG